MAAPSIPTSRAMIANPEDLVRGQSGQSDLRTATSTRAIQVYQKKEPSGAGELKQESARGGQLTLNAPWKAAGAAAA